MKPQYIWAVERAYKANKHVAFHSFPTLHGQLINDVGQSVGSVRFSLDSNRSDRANIECRAYGVMPFWFSFSFWFGVLKLATGASPIYIYSLARWRCRKWSANKHVIYLSCDPSGRDVGSLDLWNGQNHGAYRCHRPSRCRSLILKLGGFSRSEEAPRNDVHLLVEDRLNWPSRTHFPIPVARCPLPVARSPRDADALATDHECIN